MTPGDDAILAGQCAAALRAAFLAYNAEFRAITQRAKVRFEQRDWAGGQRDAAERAGLYDRHVDQSVQQLQATLGARVLERELWRATKAAFSPLIADYPDVEFMMTYFSSVTRRVFDTAGVAADVEYSGDETIPLRNIPGPLIGRNYVNAGSLQQMFAALLADFAWAAPYAHADRCAALLAARLAEHYRAHEEGDSVLCIDMLPSVFYRDTRAYVVGRATGWTRSTPLIIVFGHGEHGIAVDTAIQTDAGASVVFGFTRSWFQVDVDPVGAAIVFLRKVVPRETVHELFTILGRAKQGKTERYRGLARHMRFSKDRFVVAPGAKGLVMAVFTLPSFDVVFKVIRDQFPAPKNTSREEVRQRYELAARHNKAGRLVDTQEFRQLRFDRHRFEPRLLDELLGDAASSVQLDGDFVVVKHAYVERRVRPLDLFLREAGPSAARRAVLDYGHALRDLAATNVFPGDLLTKNFGVSRAGRVVFYDYDEICLLTDCNFREMPKARTYEDEISADPWFSVGPDDVFPEEFAPFLGFADELMATFRQAHGELLTAAWWRGMQERLRAGETFEVLPA